MTPASCKVNLQIDNERKAIGRQLGYTLTPIEDFSGLKQGYSWQELYMSFHGNISLTPISGPHDIMSRYFTEDAPYGLVLWSYIGKTVGVETSVVDAERIDAAEVDIAMAHGQQQWRGERGDEILKVAASESRFACRTEAEHAAVLGEDALLEHVDDHLTLGRPIHPSEHVIEPPSPIAVRDASFLECQRHHLLREMCAGDGGGPTISTKPKGGRRHGRPSALRCW